MALLGDVARTLIPGIQNVVPRGTGAAIGQGISGVLSSLPGNNIWGSNRPVTQAVFGGSTPYSPPPLLRPVVGPQTSPQVLGDQTYNPAASPSAPVSSSGAGASRGAPSFQNPPLVSQGLPAGPDTGMFDAIIQPALQALEGGIGSANSAYDAAVAAANQYGTKAKGQAEANTQENLGALDTRQTQEQGATTNAVNEARRGYSELAQGIQAKYGGTTGTGAFANEILGARTQQNIAGYKTQLAQSLGQISQAREHVNMVGQQALQDIEAETQTRVAAAKAQLDDTVNQIRMKQGELQSNKAQMVASAVQNYQQLLAQANQLDTQFKQQLFLQQQNAEAKLANAAQVQQQKIQSLQAFVLNPSASMAIFNPNSGQIQYSQPGQNAGYAPTGNTKNPNDPNQDPFLQDLNSLPQ